MIDTMPDGGPLITRGGGGGIVIIIALKPIATIYKQKCPASKSQLEHIPWLDL